MSSIVTLHKNSCLCTTDQLELFSLPPTNFSLEKSEYVEFFPIATPTGTSVIEFNVPSLGPFFYDLQSSFLHIQCKIVRKNGDTAATANVNDKVIPVQSFATSLFQHVHVYLNSTLVSSFEHYAYRSYLDIIMNANQVTQAHTLSALLFEPDPPGGSEKLDLPPEAKGLQARFKRTEGSAPCDLYAPVFSDISQQEKFLLNGVDVRVVLRQNTDDFRLLAADTVAQKHTVEFPRIVLYVRRLQVAPSVLLGIERRLQTTPASYLLRGLEIKYRTISPNQSQVVFDDLYSQRVPSKLTVVMVKSEAYQGHRNRNPFKFETFKLKRAVLDVGGQQYTDNFDFQGDQYAKGYMSLLHKLNKKDVPFPRTAYSKDTFMLHYRLTPNADQQSLSPVMQANVRLTLTFAANITEAVTVIFVSETPRVLEIDKDRKVKFA